MRRKAINEYLDDYAECFDWVHSDDPPEIDAMDLFRLGVGFILLSTLSQMDEILAGRSSELPVI